MTLSSILMVRPLREVALYYRIEAGIRQLLWNLIQGIYPSNRILHSNKGISLVEVLVATAFLSIIVFPLFISLRSASKANSDAEGVNLATYYGVGKIEEVLAMDFSAIPLSAPLGTPLPPPISDTVIIRGKTVNRDVYVELSDGDGDAIPDAGLKKITVSIDNISFNTLKADYPYATF